MAAISQDKNDSRNGDSFLTFASSDEKEVEITNVFHGTFTPTDKWYAPSLDMCIATMRNK